MPGAERGVVGRKEPSPPEALLPKLCSAQTDRAGVWPSSAELVATQVLSLSPISPG